MARFRQEHPELIRAEVEFYTARDATKKKKTGAVSEAGPSTMKDESTDDDIIGWDDLASSTSYSFDDEDDEWCVGVEFILSM